MNRNNTKSYNIPGDLLTDLDHPGIYVIKANGVDLYIGKSAHSMFARIAEHLKTLSKQPETYFGILPKELECGKVKINVVVKEAGMTDKVDLRDRELYYIRKDNPILQQSPNSDICIKHEKRRKAVVERLKLMGVTDD